MREFHEYYCTKCRTKTTTEYPGYVECPVCKSGENIRDFGDYEEAPYLGKDYNWNKP